uniref:adenylate/guanylate cyclase domain-containing protein n=1 Tax=Nocardioides sp. TaxID=35761 RepID=UPI0035122E61
VARVGAVRGGPRRRRRVAGAAGRGRPPEADLDAARRPRPPVSPAERAMRALVGTAARVRERGVAGMLSSSLDDLAAWASDEQSDILQVAAPDGTVTLLFSDIEDSTALNDRLGDKAWVRVLAAHDALVRAMVDKRRGRVVKTAGDSFMVAFRDPVAAVLAARGIQRALARTLDPRLRLTPVRVRIGVHTGTVISRDGDYFGRNVSMAARVAALADGGEVLVTQAVRDETSESGDRRMRFEEAGTVELKGLPGEHDLWRLVVET